MPPIDCIYVKDPSGVEHVFRVKGAEKSFRLHGRVDCSNQLHDEIKFDCDGVGTIEPVSFRLPRSSNMGNLNSKIQEHLQGKIAVILKLCLLCM